MGAEGGADLSHPTFNLVVLTTEGDLTGNVRSPFGLSQS